MKIQAFTKVEITQAIATGLLIDMFGDKIEPFTSICNGSIPTAGSPTAPLYALKQDDLFMQMNSIVLHKSGDFTIKTPSLNIRFWITEDYALLCLAHQSKKQMFNKMADVKYNCGDLI